MGYSDGVIVNEENTLEVLYYRSGLMKQLFHKFPEILLVDAIYNVNGVDMPLYCLMLRIALVMVEWPIMLQQLKKMQNVLGILISHSRMRTLHVLTYVHAIAMPISDGMVIGMVPKRWLRSHQSDGMFDQAVCSSNDHASCASGIVSEQDRIHVSNLSTKSKLSGTLPHNQKMHTLCHKLATIASLCGMRQFGEKYAQIETLVHGKIMFSWS